MKIAIIGYGEQGKAAYDYYNQPGNYLVVCDVNTDLFLPSEVKSRLGEHYLDNLDEFDLLVRTPLVHPNQIKLANQSNPNILSKVTTVTDEFFKVSPSKNIVGITGTKGKGTTSTLIAKILEVSGYNIHLGGNIGIPPLKLLQDNIRPEDWVVLELANFQLIDIKHSPHIGICLMVVPEHLDWHENYEEYLRAKQQMFKWQTTDDIAIYYSENADSNKVISVSAGHQIPYFSSPGAFLSDGYVVIDDKQVMAMTDIKLLGRHNLQNVCAAITASWQITQDIDAIRSVLSSFTGLEHRLELVRELNGVKYYDDSFGTTPETAIVAMEAFSEPKVVILGGSDKGATYNKLARAVSENNVMGVVTIGNTGPAIAESLRAIGYTKITEGGSTMAEIIREASELAVPASIVLLSTGCASFGLFKNYKDRGEQFQECVNALPESN